MGQTLTAMGPLINLEEQIWQCNMRQAAADVFLEVLGTLGQLFSLVVGYDQLTVFNTKTLVLM